MARRQRRRNPLGELPYGEWMPTHAVMFNEDGSISLMAEGGEIAEYGRLTNCGQRLRNVLDTYEEYAADIEELLNSAEERLSPHDYYQLLEVVKAMARMRLS